MKSFHNFSKLLFLNDYSYASLTVSVIPCLSMLRHFLATTRMESWQHGHFSESLRTHFSGKGKSQVGHNGIFDFCFCSSSKSHIGNSNPIYLKISSGIVRRWPVVLLIQLIMALAYRPVS